MDLSLDNLEVVARLAVALLLGGLLGFEREWHGKAAGLRTHMMVSLGAATFTIVAFGMYDRVIELAPSVARVDPLRVIDGIVGGIGFLGAGTIIQARGSVEGLTTAGSIWFVGAVGVACGGGQYVVAGIAVAMALLVLVGVGALERLFPEREARRRRQR